MTKRIGIIGFGAAGVVCLKALSQYFTPNNLPFTIDIYQPESKFANGLAYQKDEDSILLNHHHKFISTDPHNAHSLKPYRARGLGPPQGAAIRDSVG